MKTLLIAVCVVVLPLAADAAGRRPGRFQRAAGWQELASGLPGAYAYLGRLRLTQEQKEMLGEVYKEWSGRWREAAARAAAGVPRLSDKERQSPAKMRAYYVKRREARAKAKPAPPIEKVGNLLTPEQLGKVLEANRAVADWNKWLAENLPKWDAKLDAVLGPRPEGLTDQKQRAFSGLRDYLPGGALLGRLGLTEAQETALMELGVGRNRAYAELVGPLGPALRAAPLSGSQTAAVQGAVRNTGWDAVKAAHGASIRKQLSAEQLAKLAKAVAVVEERDKAISTRYAEYVAALSKILSGPQVQGRSALPKTKGTRAAGDAGKK